MIHEKTFKSHVFDFTVDGSNFVGRFLPMTNSTFIYIGQKGDERFDDLAMAMSIGNDIESALIFGTNDIPEGLARILAKKLKHQVYVGCCSDSIVPLVMPLLAKRLTEEIDNVPDIFS